MGVPLWVPAHFLAVIPFFAIIYNKYIFLKNLYLFTDDVRDETINTAAIEAVIKTLNKYPNDFYIAARGVLAIHRIAEVSKPSFFKFQTRTSLNAISSIKPKI